MSGTGTQRSQELPPPIPATAEAEGMSQIYHDGSSPCFRQQLIAALHNDRGSARICGNKLGRSRARAQTCALLAKQTSIGDTSRLSSARREEKRKAEGLPWAKNTVEF